ncbi:MAG: tetraacyldisaccharide 4'-kinase [Verrucomicrobiales bacterium]
MAYRGETSAFKEMLEELEQFAVDVILERRHGLKAMLLRALLWLLSGLFRFGVWLRHLLYHHRIFLREHNLGCLVISIGNLTVGGTGKTPVVELLARALFTRGRQVAILSRGYKSERRKVKKPSLWLRMAARITAREAPPDPPPRVVSDGRTVLLNSKQAGDEPFMLAKNLPGVSVVVDKNRVKGGLHAIREFGADTLLLDDGLQYLRLRHRLDLVLVDRTAPFGNEYLLPRGTLREPRRHLKRASYIFITKCDGTSNDELIRRLRRYNQVAEIIECNHHPRHLVNAVTHQKKPLDFLRGKYVATISGIAVPEGFEEALRQLGATVDLTRRFTDHHRYSENEIYNFVEQCERRDVEMIVTTEKDFVRFPPLPYTDVPVYYLRVQIQILSGHDAWERLVDRVCHRAMPLPTEAPATATI